MVEGEKQNPLPAAAVADLRSLLTAPGFGQCRVRAFALGFAVAFAVCTGLLALGGGTPPPWLAPALATSPSSSASYQEHISSILSRFFLNSTFAAGTPPANLTSAAQRKNDARAANSAGSTVSSENGARKHLPSPEKENSTTILTKQATGSPAKKEPQAPGSGSPKNGTLAMGEANAAKNQTRSKAPAKPQENWAAGKKQTPVEKLKSSNLTKWSVSALPPAFDKKHAGRSGDDLVKNMMNCDLFHGQWVYEESYPLYREGSCPHIDEPFDCFHNGRPDRAYQKLRWRPHGCAIPRLNGTDMLERLRGKRLVFVGDSLNRNMWESLVCVLRNSIKNKKKVVEASGRREFRTEGSYSFLFKDYNCTVEFFRSPFLVQEWEMRVGNGTKKETLRLDTMEGSASKYKNAHVIIFNTGHWWTHEKTSKGKDYYQEGNHVYGELNVADAFHKALSTWAKWVDNNVNPKKSIVFFRGYSASHFSGGQWNSGGACDRETEPIKNDTYLSPYPSKMNVLESVMKGMKVPVSYLNITRMTDYRKDAHPSVYRKQSLTEEERKSPERYQDCSHWCLPGLPDSWNELLYAQLIIKQHQMPQ